MDLSLSNERAGTRIWKSWSRIRIGSNTVLQGHTIRQTTLRVVKGRPTGACEMNTAARSSDCSHFEHMGKTPKNMSCSLSLSIPVFCPSRLSISASTLVSEPPSCNHLDTHARILVAIRPGYISSDNNPVDYRARPEIHSGKVNHARMNECASPYTFLPPSRKARSPRNSRFRI